MAKGKNQHVVKHQDGWVVSGFRTISVVVYCCLVARTL